MNLKNIFAAILFFGLFHSLGFCNSQRESVSIFRNDKKQFVFVKIKGEVAKTLFHKLEAGKVESECGGILSKKCKYRGESILCSAKNIIDPYVCELRFDMADKKLTQPNIDLDLYHSIKMNRVYGLAKLESDILTIYGDSGKELSTFLEEGRSQVQFHFVDIQKGIIK